MSLHVEWEDYVKDLSVQVLTADEAREELMPDDDVYAPYVLVLASGGGGALATGGDLDQLDQLADRIKHAVVRMRKRESS